MDLEEKLKPIEARIRVMKQAAQELKEMGDGFPAVGRNSTRILAGIKMLELNVSDLLDVAEAD
ncbi:MAG: hypothetical protein P8165_12515 [Deltaproteobacteria bacterium]|jgi:hypothetical protein